MPATARDPGWVTAVGAAYRAGRPLALMFDYDGTLTPIVPHPSQARLPAANRDRLTRLAALPGVTVGVLSGRALDEVRSFVGVHGLCYAGSGGLEMDLDGRRVVYPGADAFRRRLTALETALAPLLGRFAGTWVERKPVALAVHFRGLAPAAAVRFQAAAAAVLDRWPEVQWREVSQALEVTPAGGWDKGTAVELILDRHGPDVLAVYAGDAANDAEAMAVTGLTGGVAIGIGPNAPPTATHQLATSADLEGCLDRLVRELDPGTTPAAVRAMARPSTPAVVPGPDTGPGLLLVDPDPAARDAAAAALRRHGWRVWTADPDDAERVLGEHLPDIHAAVVDLELQGLLGMRVLTALGVRRPGLVRCGLSADVRGYTAAAFRRLSSVHLLAKPLDPDRAAEALQRLTGAASGRG